VDISAILADFARNLPEIVHRVIRGNSKNFIFQRTCGTNGVKRADPHPSGSRIEAAVDIDRLPGDVAIACEHHGNMISLSP
jgi:hypothetical protein